MSVFSGRVDYTCSNKKLRHVAVRNEGSKFSPNLFQARVTLFASVLYKLFFKVSSSVISVSFRVELCTVYLGVPEWVYRWFEAGKSLIQKKRLCDAFLLFHAQLSNFTL